MSRLSASHDLTAAASAMHSGSIRPSIDAETTDFYDGPEGLPAPHRLSSRYSGSPYPEPRASFDRPLQGPSSGNNTYADPFIASSSSSNINNIGASASSIPLHRLSADQRSPSAAALESAPSDPFLSGQSPHSSFDQLRRSSMGYYPQNDPAGLYPPSPSGHHYANGAGTSSPAPGSLYNYGYGQHALPYGGSPLATPTAPGSSVEDFSYRNEADTWGVPQSSSSGSLARERYLARKEAQAAAASEKAGLFGGGAKEGDDYGDHSYSYGALGGKRGGGSRRKWWLIGGGVVLLAIVGVVIGIVVSRKISNSASSNAGVEGVVKQAGSDPSNFEKDSRLHNSFFGMCYTPLNSQYPACGDTLDAVIEDVQLLSQLTTRLRLYGADCNVTALTLEAIQRTKTNLTIFPAIWINGDDTIYSRGADAIISALQTYGTDHVAGISVGNEYMLNGGNLTYLGAKIADMRSRIAALGLGKPIPVGTADAGSKITEALAATCDYVMSNVHPWFGGVPVDQAAGWTWDYFNTNTPAVALSTPNKPAVYIAETGWPTGANATAFETFQGAIAGVDELNTFLSTFVCQANANGTTADTFWFEAFDEPWKDPLYGGVEAHWGLFNSNKTLKSGVVIPNCAHS